MIVAPVPQVGIIPSRLDGLACSDTQECHLKGRVLVSIEIKFRAFSRISFPI